MSKIAIITPSYRGDFERCRLLCDTLDAVGGSDWQHLLLVSDQDRPLFDGFQSTRRQVIADSAYMPQWLRPVMLPRISKPRWISFSPRYPIWPMSGWHVQQIRKLYAARLTDAPVLLMADSDTVFVKPVSAEALFRHGMLRLYRRPAQITGIAGEHDKHRLWLKSTAALLGVSVAPLPADDYINNLVTWRRDVVLGLIAHIEAQTDKPLVAALGRHRSFSEYLIYGQFSDRILAESSGHWHSETSLGHTYWSGAALDAQSLDGFLGTMAEDQIAFGVQSFTATSVDLIRQAVLQVRSPGARASTEQD
jgi:hypothetical protein